MLEIKWEALPKRIITMFYLYTFIFIKMDVPKISACPTKKVAKIQSQVQRQNSQG